MFTSFRNSSHRLSGNPYNNKFSKIWRQSVASTKISLLWIWIGVVIHCILAETIFNICAFFLYIYIVGSFEISQHCNIRGYLQRMLWSLCHLQLYGIPYQLSNKPVSESGINPGSQRSTETYPSFMLLSTMDHGRVSMPCFSSFMFWFYLSCHFSAKLC